MMRTAGALAVLFLLLGCFGCRVLAGVPTDEDPEESCGGDPSGGGLVEVPASGGLEVQDGALGSSDPTWSRPDSSCSGGTSMESYYYDVWTLNNSWGLDAEVTVDAIGIGLGDTMLFAYEGGVLPGDLLSCVESDDDSGSGTDASVSLSIPAGSQLTVVVTSFGVEDCGTYELHVSTQ